jgi:hypothetical protein
VYDTVLDLFSIQSATFDRAGSFIKKAAVPADGDAGHLTTISAR